MCYLMEMGDWDRLIWLSTRSVPENSAWLHPSRLRPLAWKSEFSSPSSAGFGKAPTGRAPVSICCMKCYSTHTTAHTWLMDVVITFPVDPLGLSFTQLPNRFSMDGTVCSYWPKSFQEGVVHGDFLSAPLPQLPARKELHSTCFILSTF